MPVTEDFLEIPLPLALQHLAGRRWWRTTLLRALDLLLINPVLFYHLKRRGVQVLVWVLNDHGAIERAFLAGGSGVMTGHWRTQ